MNSSALAVENSPFDKFLLEDLPWGNADQLIVLRIKTAKATYLVQRHGVDQYVLETDDRYFRSYFRKTEDTVRFRVNLCSRLIDRSSPWIYHRENGINYTIGNIEQINLTLLSETRHLPPVRELLVRI